MNDVGIHRLKTWPELFAAVVAGDKTFEWRKADRNFEEGDVRAARSGLWRTGWVLRFLAHRCWERACARGEAMSRVATVQHECDRERGMMIKEHIRKSFEHEGHELNWEKGRDLSYLTIQNETRRECVAITHDQLSALRDFLVAALHEIDRAPRKRKAAPSP